MVAKRPGRRRRRTCRFGEHIRWICRPKVQSRRTIGSTILIAELGRVCIVPSQLGHPAAGTEGPAAACAGPSVTRRCWLVPNPKATSRLFSNVASYWFRLRVGSRSRDQRSCRCLRRTFGPRSCAAMASRLRCQRSWLLNQVGPSLIRLAQAQTSLARTVKASISSPSCGLVPGLLLLREVRV